MPTASPALPPGIDGLILLGLLALLILLRFDAWRFGAAEFDDEDAPGAHWLTRLAWYAAGFVLVVGVYYFYDRPLSVLHLTVGTEPLTAIIFGLLLGVLGGGAAFYYGVWRYGELQLPPARRYSAAVVNCVGTAFLDEAVFRGILLGLTVASGWPVDLAILFQACLYGLATRLGSRGQPPGPLLIALAIGVGGGWITLQTGGIGAAVLAHALTRLSLFVATGHAGALRMVVPEEEATQAAREQPPEGWSVVEDEHTGYGEKRWY
jgi:membrane protease YdiL (CAAX protease family)